MTYVSFDHNAYYNPESVGAKIVGVLEEDEPYEFDMLVVLHELKTGKLYMQYDSGCSCPTPFEDFSFPDDWIEIGHVDQLKRFIQHNQSEYTGRWREADIQTLTQRVDRALHNV